MYVLWRLPFVEWIIATQAQEAHRHTLADRSHRTEAAVGRTAGRSLDRVAPRSSAVLDSRQMIVALGSAVACRLADHVHKGHIHLAAHPDTRMCSEVEVGQDAALVVRVGNTDHSQTLAVGCVRGFAGRRGREKPLYCTDRLGLQSIGVDAVVSLRHVAADHSCRMKWHLAVRKRSLAK